MIVPDIWHWRQYAHGVRSQVLQNLFLGGIYYTTSFEIPLFFKQKFARTLYVDTVDTFEYPVICL